MNSWPCDATEKIRRLIDMVTVCALDAGAGENWKYLGSDGQDYRRSEGLANASWTCSLTVCSSDKAVPCRVNSLGLKSLAKALRRDLQVTCKSNGWPPWQVQT